MGDTEGQQLGETPSGSDEGRQQGGTPTVPGTDQQQGQDGKQVGEQPPWGEKPEDFNPATAWQLIQNLRKEKGFDKAQRLAELERKTQEAENANLTKTQRLQKAHEDLTSENAGLKAQIAVYKAASTHGVDADLLDGIPAERVEAVAQKLAAKLGTTPPQSQFVGNPKQRLPGGADPTIPSEETDLDKIAQNVYK